MSLVSEELADGRGWAAFGSDRETGEYLRSKAEVDHRRSIPKGSDCETPCPIASWSRPFCPALLRTARSGTLDARPRDRAEVRRQGARGGRQDGQLVRIVASWLSDRINGCCAKHAVRWGVGHDPFCQLTLRGLQARGHNVTYCATPRCTPAFFRQE